MSQTHHVILKVDGKSIRCSNRFEAERFSVNAEKLHADKVLSVMEREINSGAHNSPDFAYYWRQMADLFPNRPATKIIPVPMNR